MRALKRYRDLSDRDIAEIVGWTRQKVQSYAAGPTKFTDEALAMFAYALRVPVYVLLYDQDDALRWVLDHSPSGPNGGPPSGDVLYPPWDSNPEPADSERVLAFRPRRRDRSEQPDLPFLPGRAA